jgi:hypothetical protein
MSDGSIPDPPAARAMTDAESLICDTLLGWKDRAEKAEQRLDSDLLRRFEALDDDGKRMVGAIGQLVLDATASLRQRLAEAEEHERQTHEQLGAILGTEDALHVLAARLKQRAERAEKALWAMTYLVRGTSAEEEQPFKDAVALLERRGALAPVAEQPQPAALAFGHVFQPRKVWEAGKEVEIPDECGFCLDSMLNSPAFDPIYCGRTRAEHAPEPAKASTEPQQ